METDEVLISAGTRWVFRGYAILAAVAGVVISGWGMVWLGSDLPGMPFYKASLIRVAGGVLMAAACFAAALDRVDDPDVRRRALVWFGVGHAVLFVVLWTQQGAIWNSPMVDTILTVVLLTAFTFFYMASGADAGAEPDPNRTVLSLFGAPPVSRENLRRRYQRQIRAAALQEERHRLARDLHDSIKQQIFAIQTAAATAQTRFDSDAAGTRAALEQVRASAREAMAEMEAMLDQLHAAPLENAGLVASLRKQCEALGFRTGAKVEFEPGALPDNLEVEPGAQEALFRVAQEALANVARHARAARVRVVLSTTQRQMKLTIEDDGAGFDIAQPARGMGLANIEARAAEFGGTFDLSSTSGGGTRVEVAVPCAATSSIADYNRRLAWYGAAAVIHFGVGAWRHSSMFFFLGVMWCIYFARVAALRSAARRRAGAVR